MRTASNRRNPRERRLARGQKRKALWDKYNNDTPLWCHKCGFEITGQRREHMQCHTCHTWNTVVAGKGFPAQFEE